MADLSPAAQAVLDALYMDELNGPQQLMARAHAAAALRAAADQVVPEPPMLVPGGRSYEAAWSVTVQSDVRAKFLAIADELDSPSP